MASEAQQVELVVVGLGPGGEALATATAKAGLDVVAVDRHLVGGECPYYGCVPTKMMVRGSDVLAEAGRAGELAGEVTIRPSWTPVAERVSVQATDHWDDRVAVERLEKAGATVRHGVARLDGRTPEGRHRVTVTPPDGSEPVTYEATRGVVLNPGTRPATPPIDGLADTPFWTNRDAVQVTELPGSLVVIGGGPIGCELAQVFARFGVEVTLVQHGDRILAVNEPEASALLTEVFAHDGIRVITGSDATKASYADGRFSLTLDSGEQLTADQVLVAAGRIPNHDDIGLETVGLDPTARTVPVDERMHAGDGLWVIGDVTGHGAFTHLSMYQYAIARRDILGEGGRPAEYHAVPHVTFCDPEVAGVGMTEAQARDAGLEVRVGTTKLEESTRGFTHGPGSRGLIKVVEDADRGVLVGATVVGPYGGEIIGFFVVAVHAGVPVDTLRSMIYAYPTFHRAIESALADLDD